MTDDQLPEFHARALDATRAFVARINDDQWNAPTPNSDWDVRELLNHVVGGNLWVAPLVEGKSIEEVGDRYDGDILGNDPLAAWDTSSASAAAAFRSPGAMEKPVAVSYGPVPGSVYCGHRLVDVLIHGWDLAVATGQDRRLDPELVRVAWEIFEPQAEGWRSAGAIGAKVDVPDDADPQTRLLGLLGRSA